MRALHVASSTHIPARATALFTAPYLPLLVLFLALCVSIGDAFMHADTRMPAVCPSSSPVFAERRRRSISGGSNYGSVFISPRRNSLSRGTSVELKATNGSNNNSNEEVNAIVRATQVITSTPASKSLPFSAIMMLCGAALGPFLDSYHSLFGVLSYEQPLQAYLWGSGSSSNPDLPALVTAWWVPELFGLAGFIIGWLYIVLDEALGTPRVKREPLWPLIFVGISFFTLQYWLSGVMYANGIDRTTILNVMSVLAAMGFAALDLTEAGFWTSLATAVGGPAIECVLITVLVGHGGYHYNDLGETGFFPLWILPVYFLGGPAVGNLARGFWQVLTDQDTEIANAGNDDDADALSKSDGPRCNVCNDSRAVGCPNCDAQGYYITYGRKVRKKNGDLVGYFIKKVWWKSASQF